MICYVYVYVWFKIELKNAKNRWGILNYNKFALYYSNVC